MKTTTILAIALGVGTLAACNKTPQEQTADNIEANAENTADTIEANADNASDMMKRMPTTPPIWSATKATRKQTRYATAR